MLAVVVAAALCLALVGTSFTRRTRVARPRPVAACNFGGTPRGDAHASACACEDAWDEPSRCAALRLGEARESIALGGGGPGDTDGWSVWGASVLEHGGVYHAFASLIANRCPVFPHYWLSNSVVVRAESASADGPFRVLELVLGPEDADVGAIPRAPRAPSRGVQPRGGAAAGAPPRFDDAMAHNPTVHVAPDGSILLYYTGASLGGTAHAPRPQCAGGARPVLAAEHVDKLRASQRIGVARAPSPLGPWTLGAGPVLAPSAEPGAWDGGFVTNPMPVVLRNGTVLLGYKGVQSGRPLRMRLGLARARAWTDDRCERLTPAAPLFPELCANVTPAWKCQVEDGFMWRARASEHDGAEPDARPFHLLFKDQHGVLGAEAGGGIHAVSADGLRWRLARPRVAYDRTVRWATAEAASRRGGPRGGGEEEDERDPLPERTTRLRLRERTQLLRGADGGVRLTHAYHAASDGVHEHTFNLVTRIGRHSRF